VIVFMECRYGDGYCVILQVAVVSVICDNGNGGPDLCLVSRQFVASYFVKL